MAEFTVSCLRIKGCRKPNKLEDKMIKELRRTAGVTKNKNIKCTVHNEMVKFKGKNEVIDCQKIERIQRNNDYGVIIVVVKTKKNYSKLFAMRFLDNSEFLRFYDTINPAPTSVVVFEERGQSATSKKRKRSRTKSETNRAEPVLTTKVPSSQAPGSQRRWSCDSEGNVRF